MEIDWFIVFKVIILVVMLVGQAGLIIPILPGLVIIWAAALVYGLVAGFDLVSGILFGVMTILMLVGSVIDNVMMGASAKLTGASWWAVGLAFIASMAGTVLLPPVGGLLGALLVLFVVEWIRLRNWRIALDSTRNMALGCGGSVLVRAGMGFIMLAAYLYWAFWYIPG